MDAIQIRLAALWAAVMITYLLREVLRLSSEGFRPGEVGGRPVSNRVWLWISVVLLIPIFMIFLSTTMDYGLNRLANIILPAVFILLHVIISPAYTSAHSRLLIVAGLVLNALTVWQALVWR